MTRPPVKTDDVATRLERLEGKVDAILQLPMQTLKWIGGLVVGAAITVLTQNFILHEQTAQTADKAVAAATSAAQTSQATNQKVTAALAKQGTPP